MKKRLHLDELPLMDIFPCMKIAVKPEYFGERRVLLIEDDRTVIWTVSEALNYKCLLSVAQDAVRGMSLYNLFQPDMILLDIGLPGRDGLSLLEDIMKINPEEYVVIFTGQSDNETVNRAVALGAKGFVKKPFAPGSQERILKHLYACVPDTP